MMEEKGIVRRSTNKKVVLQVENMKVDKMVKNLKGQDYDINTKMLITK